MYTLHLSGDVSLQNVLQQFEAHVRANGLSPSLQQKVTEVARNLDQSGRNVLAVNSTMNAQQVVDVEGSRIKVVASYGAKPRRSLWAMVRGIFTGQRQ